MSNVLTTIALMCIVVSFLVTSQFHSGAFTGFALGLSLASYLTTVASRIEKTRLQGTSK